MNKKLIFGALVSALSVALGGNAQAFDLDGTFSGNDCTGGFTACSQGDNDSPLVV